MKKQDETKPYKFLEEFKKNKGMQFLGFIVIIYLLLGSLFGGKSFFQMSFPYLLMSLGLITMMLIKDKKLNTLILLFIFTSIPFIQLFYYGVFPLQENYIPVTIPYMMSMFQMNGKFHITYSPDFPVQGDTIVSYIDVCDNELQNCTELNNYTITAYFKDEGGGKHILLDNETIEKEFLLTYGGKPIYIDFTYSNTPRISGFIIPKPSFSQSLAEIIPKNPIFSFLGLISSLLGLWIIVELIKKFWNFIGKNIQQKLKLVLNTG